VEGAEAAGLSEAARAHDRAHPFAFSGHVTRPVVSAYVQDSWRATGRLTVEAGLRYDRSRLLVAERQWSPRAGAAYRFGRARLRLSANRFFQPPQTEFLLLSSSPQAHALSPFRDELGRGGADVRAERQTAVEAGCELTLGRGLRADVAVWRRWMRNQGDPNLFFGTTIIFPNSVARGVARGLDARVELPRYRGVAAFVTYTLAQVEQFGPIDGGLFLEDDIIEIGPGTRFVPDHDQRHAVTAQVAYDGVGGWATVAARYRTGTPLEVPEEELDEISAREGADLVDLEAGRVRPHLVLDVEAGRRLLSRQGFELSARVAALNVTGARYAFNFANPFSGTHFGAPRTARLDLRLALR
jgi:outer membrane receptor protein involved in Fe transport